jgi:hypothetical protein
MNFGHKDIIMLGLCFPRDGHFSLGGEGRLF